MSVSVVIATRDRRDSLVETLTRLATLRERPEVIVVDNGSRDGTPDAAAAAGARVVRCRDNEGAAARTFGVRAARTPYVAFSDDDSWWAPGALSRAAELFDRHPRLGLLAARIVVEPGGELDATCAAMANSPLPPDPELPGPPVLGFVACGAVVRREAFLATGGFDPHFGVGGEEKLLAVDLAAAGWGLAYADDVVAHHRPQQGDRPQRRRQMVRNELWTAWLRRPAASALWRTAALVAAAPRDAGASLAPALRGLPWIARGRRPVPPRLDAALRLLERSTV